MMKQNHFSDNELNLLSRLKDDSKRDKFDYLGLIDYLASWQIGRISNILKVFKFYLEFLSSSLNNSENLRSEIGNELIMVYLTSLADYSNEDLEND